MTYKALNNYYAYPEAILLDKYTKSVRKSNQV